MFKLGRDSEIVKAWVTLVLMGTYTLDQVPKIFGIYDAVKVVIDEITGLEGN